VDSPGFEPSRPPPSNGSRVYNYPKSSQFRTADFISFAKSKGLYAGLNLDGSYIDVRESINKAYYGKEATPADIIVKHSVSNKGAVPLREKLKKAQYRLGSLFFGMPGRGHRIPVAPFFNGGGAELLGTGGTS